MVLLDRRIRNAISFFHGEQPGMSSLVADCSVALVEALLVVLALFLKAAAVWALLLSRVFCGAQRVARRSLDADVANASSATAPWFMTSSSKVSFSVSVNAGISGQASLSVSALMYNRTLCGVCDALSIDKIKDDMNPAEVA